MTWKRWQRNHHYGAMNVVMSSWRHHDRMTATLQDDNVIVIMTTWRASWRHDFVTRDVIAWRHSWWQTSLVTSYRVTYWRWRLGAATLRLGSLIDDSTPRALTTWTWFITETSCNDVQFNVANNILLHFAWVVDDAKFIVVTRVCVCVCLSAAACPHLHGPGCNLGEW